VSCSSPRACTAVGYAADNAGSRVPLAENWNGSTWTIQPVPGPARRTNPALWAVSCSSADACTGVGTYNGPAGQSAGLIERWNGAHWTQQRPAGSGRQDSFFGVACPSATACTAVGYVTTAKGSARPLAQEWNGSTWLAQHVPAAPGSSGGVFAAVSCSSPDACTATGAAFNTTGDPLAQRWNGTLWRSQTTIAPLDYETSFSEVGMAGVSCPSVRACTAIGDFTPGNFSASFAEGWDGEAWSMQAAAVPAGNEQDMLSGISCVTARCAAVGSYIGPSGILLTMAQATPG